MARNLEDFVGNLTQEQNVEMLKLLFNELNEHDLRMLLLEELSDDDLEELYLALEQKFGD